MTPHPLLDQVLKMEARCSSEVLISAYKTTQCQPRPQFEQAPPWKPHKLISVRPLKYQEKLFSDIPYSTVILKT
jgi:hypothetical protein